MVTDGLIQKPTDQPKEISLHAREGIVAGTWLIIASAMMFALGGAATKFLSTDVPPSSILLWRNLLGGMAVIIWIAPQLGCLEIPRAWSMHLLRGLVTFAGLWCYFLSLTQVPLATAVMLRTASPAFVPIFAYLAYRRISSRNAWMGACIGLVGVAVALDPITPSADVGTILGLVSGMVGAWGAILIWRLGGTESASVQTAWLAIVMAGLSLVLAPWLLTWPSAADWPIVIFVAVTTTVSQFLLARAFTLVAADKVMPWSYLAVAFGAVLGFVGWGDALSLNTVLGTSLMVAGSLMAAGTFSRLSTGPRR